jgi:crotonobetainyl-CoA:carnitine CoA-transferase CaiB-like acyl-CoA transferase
MTGEDPEKTGTGHSGVVPYGAFECGDGWIVLANFGDGFWAKICVALGFPEMAYDARYDTNAKRIERRDEVEAMVAAAFRRKDVAEWDRILEEADVPHAPILTVSEVLDHPQVRARGMVVDVQHATLGRWRALGRAIRFPAHVEDGRQTAAPVLGQHTAEILRDLLGYPPELIRSLAAGGVIQTWPDNLSGQR